MEISDSLLKDVSRFTYIRYEIFSLLEPPRQNLIVLKGARGIGKSTLVLQYLLDKQKHDHKVMYVSADSTILTTSLAELAHEFYKRGGNYLVVDEIHKYPNWQQNVKTIVDAFPSLKLIASGSSSLHLNYAAADLSRRHIMIQAKGLSFREYLNKNYHTKYAIINLQDILIHAAEIAVNIVESFKNTKIDILECFHKYLREGYFITREEYSSIKIYFASLINAINSTIDIDLLNVYQDVDQLSLKNIKQLLKHIAQKCPFTPNITELKNALNIANANTLKKYLKYLHDGEVLLNLYTVNKSHKDFQRPQKIFLNNTNYAYAFGDTPDIGTIRETFVANCLLGQGELTAPTYGDFCLDNNLVFEVGGKSKTNKQIKSIQNSYVLADNILSVDQGKIPLWLLGFLW
jgi:predicted AAA+ superfamily ATPase